MGCGYTGRLAARTLLEKGFRVTATTRNPAKLGGLARAGVRVVRLEVLELATIAALEVPQNALVIDSIPPVGDIDPTAALVQQLGTRPAKVLYISTTGVYGETRQVNENTRPAPRTDREQLRRQAEAAVEAGPWPSLILRSPAIYGPDRGVHVSIKAGTYRLPGSGLNFISRIHVEDLAAHAVAGLLSSITGAWPVADQEPCTSAEIARYCSELLGLPMPPQSGSDSLHESRRTDRRVNGEAIRRLLDVVLRYPSYREGIRAAVETGWG
ncbi:MAG: NAD(P)H-binding protein [Bryobacterales bacterium]|nr:NAD(P)H-binding protein [Bryobacterales bacterium]